MTSATAQTTDDVLWDVVEEHLAEAQFGVDQMERCFDSPVATLESLSRGIESRLRAHLDGLAASGAAVQAKLLDPIAKTPDPENPAALVVAGVALARGGQLDALLTALAHDDDSIRRAGVRGLSLGAPARIERWLIAKLGERLAPRLQASLLHVAWQRGVRISPLVARLQGPDPLVVRCAAHAAGHAEAAIHAPVLEHLLDHPDARVAEAALVPLLAWGSRRASQACRQWALDPQTPRALPMILLAALEGPSVHEELAARLARPTHAKAVLVALGHSGNLRVVPRLLELVEGRSPLLRKIAAHSISMITGLKWDDVSTHETTSLEPKERAQDAEKAEEREALPPIEEDDLDADLVPAPEEALPDVEPSAVRAHCREAVARMSFDCRWLCGKPFGIPALVDALRDLPLGARHSLATVLFIRTNAAMSVNTRSWSGDQIRRLGALGDPSHWPVVPW